VFRFASRLHPAIGALLGAAIVAAGLVFGLPVIAIVGAALLIASVWGWCSGCQ
jgi:hypothetical protein